MLTKGDRVTIFAPGDDLDGRKGFVALVSDSGRTVLVEFGGALAFAFEPSEIREGW